SNGRRRRRRRSTISWLRRSCIAAPMTTPPTRRRCRKMSDVRPNFQYAVLPQQQEAAQLGIWAFLATEVLFFGVLIVAYSVYRFTYPDAFADAGRHTKIVIGGANTAILLTSSFAVAWAVESAKAGLGSIAARLLCVAALLGVVFLGLKGLEYWTEYREHLVPA